MGNDNPYSVFWTLMAARLFSREDGSTSLIGFNFSMFKHETLNPMVQLQKQWIIELCKSFHKFI